MVRAKDPTEHLLKKFNQKGGVEGENLDFKSKGILDSPKGKRKLTKVASAIANTGGGTIIVGARKDNDKERSLQSFDTDTEAKQYLSSTFHDNTEPDLNKFVNIYFSEALGNSLLRIDIRRPKEPIKFDSKSRSGFFKRAGDTTREVDREEIQEILDRGADRDYNLKEPIRSIEFDETPSNHKSVKMNLDRRFVSRTSEDIPIVFGQSLCIDTIYGSSCLYALSSGSGARDIEGLENALDALGESFNAKFDKEYPTLSYTIMGQGYQLHGTSREQFIKDIKNWSNLRRKIESEFGLEETHYSFAIGAYPVGNNIYFLTAETRDNFDTFKFTETGFLMPDIPFNDSGYKQYFSKINVEPHVYEEISGTRILKINNNLHLEDPEIQHLRYDPTEYPGKLYVSAKNPFYGKKDYFENRYEDLPYEFMNAITAHNRLPFKIAGGAPPDSPTNYFLSNLELTSLPQLSIPSMFLSSICFDYEE